MRLMQCCTRQVDRLVEIRGVGSAPLTPVISLNWEMWAFRDSCRFIIKCRFLKKDFPMF